MAHLALVQEVTLLKGFDESGGAWNAPGGEW